MREIYSTALDPDRGLSASLPPIAATKGLTPSSLVDTRVVNTAVTVMHFSLPDKGQTCLDGSFSPSWRFSEVFNCGAHVRKPGPFHAKARR